jgi:hypothetical protein
VRDIVVQTPRAVRFKATARRRAGLIFHSDQAPTPSRRRNHRLAAAVQVRWIAPGAGSVGPRRFEHNGLVDRLAQTGS